MPQFSPLFHFNQALFILVSFTALVYYMSTYLVPASTRLQVVRVFLVTL